MPEFKDHWELLDRAIERGPVSAADMDLSTKLKFDNSPYVCRETVNGISSYIPTSKGRQFYRQKYGNCKTVADAIAYKEKHHGASSS